MTISARYGANFLPGHHRHRDDSCSIGSLVISLHHRGSDRISMNKIGYRARYFTDSGIIGSKEFAAANYQRFKHLFYSKHEKKPKAIKSLEWRCIRLSDCLKLSEINCSGDGVLPYKATDSCLFQI